MIQDESSESIVDRWQAAAAIYALSLAHCISPYGKFTRDAVTAQICTTSCLHSQKHPPLRILRKMRAKKTVSHSSDPSTNKYA